MFHTPGTGRIVYLKDCRYDATRKKSLTWTQKLSDRLNLAHVARKKYEKEETKTNKRQCPLSSVQVQDPWRMFVFENFSTYYLH